MMSDIPKHDWVSDEISWSSALIEWESGGLDDIPTENLFEFQEALSNEINKRRSKYPLYYQGIGGKGSSAMIGKGKGGNGSSEREDND